MGSIFDPLLVGTCRPNPPKNVAKQAPGRQNPRLAMRLGHSEGPFCLLLLLAARRVGSPHCPNNGITWQPLLSHVSSVTPNPTVPSTRPPRWCRPGNQKWVRLCYGRIGPSPFGYLLLPLPLDCHTPHDHVAHRVATDSPRSQFVIGLTAIMLPARDPRGRSQLWMNVVRNSPPTHLLRSSRPSALGAIFSSECALQKGGGSWCENTLGGKGWFFKKGAQLFPAQFLVPYHTIGSTHK